MRSPASPSFVFVHAHSFALATSVSLFLGACAHDEPPPQSPTPAVVSTQAEMKPPAAPAALVVSESVRAKCSFPETPSSSPQFDFDDADLRTRGMGILDALAACMVEGSMKDRGITVIGYTDPRGSDTYNRDLGLKRATATRDYLVGKGVAVAAVTVKSRGEQDATGEGAPGWQLDRRVEIEETSANMP